METKSCFDSGSVITGLESRDKYSAIHELICRAPVFRRIDDVDYLEEAINQNLDAGGLEQALDMENRNQVMCIMANRRQQSERSSG